MALVSYRRSSPHKMYFRAVDRILHPAYSAQQCSILFPRLRREFPVGFRSHSAVPFAVSTAPAFLAGPQLQNS